MCIVIKYKYLQIGIDNVFHIVLFQMVFLLTENDTVFLQGKLYIHIDCEVSLLRIYYKEKIRMHKGLTRVLVTVLFIIIMKSWKQYYCSVFGNLFSKLWCIHHFIGIECCRNILTLKNTLTVNA